MFLVWQGPLGTRYEYWEFLCRPSVYFNREVRIFRILSLRMTGNARENRMGDFRKGGSCNNRFALKPDVATASDMLIFSRKNNRVPRKENAARQLFWQTPFLELPPICDPKRAKTHNAQVNFQPFSLERSLSLATSSCAIESATTGYRLQGCCASCSESRRPR